MEPEERARLLKDFCLKIAPEQHLDAVFKVLSENGMPLHLLHSEMFKEFHARDFHPSVVQHSRKYFLERNYFHAVFEACKAYNRAVQDKSGNSKDGEGLMMDVWAPEKGALKITACKTETDKNVQDGVKFMSAGVMRAARNPPAHETAIDWPIKKEDCLDILSLLSFLFRQLDKAVVYKGP